MTKALVWIRKSKGSDDDVGLADQREKVTELAHDVADDVDTLDLGVHTGFSSMTRDGTGLLDQNPRVQDAVTRLQNGDYDYVVAWDDRRIARDEYFEVIRYAMRQGDCEFVYHGDVIEDDLTHDIKRRIERDTKEEEINKSQMALERRAENGCYQGRPPAGLKFAPDKCHLEKSDEWDDVDEALTRLAAGNETMSEIASDIDRSISWVSRLNSKGREYYDDLLAEYGRPETAEL